VDKIGFRWCRNFCEGACSVKFSGRHCLSTIQIRFPRVFRPFVLSRWLVRIDEFKKLSVRANGIDLRLCSCAAGNRERVFSGASCSGASCSCEKRE